MEHPGAIYVSDRFPELRRHLLELLRDLSNDDWSRPTAAPLWSVKDIVAHLLCGDIGILSRGRDAFVPPGQSIQSYAELVAFINQINHDWVHAARRMSPRVLCELLEFTGPLVEAYFSSLDPDAMGGPVDWAGPDPAPVWFDLARVTERWHHQQQIRDATDRPHLYDPHFFRPVLDTFVRALPHTYRDSAAPEGTLVHIGICGEAGGNWSLRRSLASWELYVSGHAGSATEPASEVLIPQDIAWRLFTRGISGHDARAMSVIRGDSSLAAPVFATIAVLA